MMIIFYDGDCGLCQRSIQIVMKYDQNKIMHFAPLNGETFRKFFGQKDSELKTLLFLREQKVYERSQAIIEIGKLLGAQLRIAAYLLMTIPRPIRDYFYSQISSRRKSIACVTLKRDERFLP